MHYVNSAQVLQFECHNHPGRSMCHGLHLTSEGTKAERDHMTCPRLRRARMERSSLNPGLVILSAGDTSALNKEGRGPKRCQTHPHHRRELSSPPLSRSQLYFMKEKRYHTCFARFLSIYVSLKSAATNDRLWSLPA